MRPPFRADHVGSLLRPHELHELREQVRLGKASASQLKEAEDRLIREAVKLQEDLGLQSITDGEFRRDWWHIDFLAGFDGVTLKYEEGDAYRGTNFKGTEAKPPTMFVTGKLKRSKPSMVSHFEFLKKITTRGMPKFTMPSPAMLHARGDRDSIRKVYPNADNFWADLTQCYREELAGLYQAGCRYVQIDDTTIAMFGDPKVQEGFRKLGDDPKKDVAIYAEAVNAAIRDVPDDMTVAIHTCRGNYKSTWLASGSYDYVAQTAFSKIDVDGFFLEFDDERSGGFEPLKHVAKGKKVVLGLVSSKVAQLESKDALKRRIEAASKYVPMENLCLSPQCGFSSTHHGNNLTVEQEKAKLRLCIDTAKEVWDSRSGMKPIPETSIFDLRLSRRGKRLNRMCTALCSPAEREAFKRDEEAFMARFSLTEEEKALIRNRDFTGLIEAGMNIYAMLKIGSATGNSLYRMGAQMRGESYEEFLKTRNISGAV